jgi:hypothetical protein
MSGMRDNVAGDNVAQTVRNDGLITITQGPQQQAQSDKPGDLKGFVFTWRCPGEAEGRVLSDRVDTPPGSPSRSLPVIPANFPPMPPSTGRQWSGRSRLESRKMSFISRSYRSGPEMVSVLSFDKLPRDPQSITSSSHAPEKDSSHVQPLANRADVDVLALEGERRSPRHHMKLLKEASQLHESKGEKIF